MSFSTFFRDHPRLRGFAFCRKLEQVLAFVAIVHYAILVALHQGAGDKPLLFTAGLVEAENLALEESGDGRLMLEAAVGDRALDMQQRVRKQVSAFCNSNFRDDATLVVVRMA